MVCCKCWFFLLGSCLVLSKAVGPAKSAMGNLWPMAELGVSNFSGILAMPKAPPASCLPLYIIVVVPPTGLLRLCTEPAMLP